MNEPTVNTLIQFRNVDVGITDALLQGLMGMEYSLYIKTQNYHWNLVGMSFLGIHKLLGKQYEQIGQFIDRIAEQIRALGRPAPGSLREMEYRNELVQGITPVSGQIVHESTVVTNLLGDHNKVISYITALDYNKLDLATQNLLGEILQFHMKAAWVYQSHITH